MSPYTLKVYIAAISASYDAVNGSTLGKRNLTIQFLRDARPLNPFHPPVWPSWDLPVVQACLQRDPFKPLDSVSDAGMDQEGL